MSAWHDIRCPDGDLLARIKASSLEEAVAIYWAMEERRMRVGTNDVPDGRKLMVGRLN